MGEFLQGQSAEWLERGKGDCGWSLGDQGTKVLCQGGGSENGMGGAGRGEGVPGNR